MVTSPQETQRSRGHAWIAEHLDAHLDTLIRVCEVPAPTFAESARADHVRAALEALGHAPESDAVGNLWVRLPPAGEGPTTLVAAHLDTVFDAGTDVTVRRSGGRLLAPGIGDDGAALAALLTLARLVAEVGGPPGRVILAFTVGEEGLGNLRGSRALLEALHGEVDQVLALDGQLDQVVDRAVGSRRHRILLEGPGGHSWSDYGRPSAVHHLAGLVTRLGGLQVPSDPRCSLNVGTFHGGTTVNAIASRAEVLVDLRSVDPEALGDLEVRVLAQIEAFADEARHQGLTLTREQVGERPAGGVDNQGLLAALDAAAAAEGWALARRPGSTDAAAAAAWDLPAACLGVYRGGGAHTLDEWLEVASLEPGLRFLWSALLEVQGRSGPTATHRVGPPKGRD